MRAVFQVHFCNLIAVLVHGLMKILPGISTLSIAFTVSNKLSTVVTERNLYALVSLKREIISVTNNEDGG